MKRILLFVLFVTVGIATAIGQRYNGTVVDQNNRAIENVSVVLYDANRPVGFGKTNSKGEFVVAPQRGNPMVLQLSKVGYSTLKIPLEQHKNGNRYMLDTQTVELTEVKVKPDKAIVGGDTVTYLVSAYMQKQDRSIADVLAKIPGIEVKSSGQITVDGQPINKFYIEGMDLLGGKYSLASENLAAKKVSRVQVLNNHQPVKALKNVRFSEQAALNIVLKDDAKNVWQALIEAAGGHSLQSKSRWMHDARLLAMLFAKKRQSISMYKTNNTGKDIAHEISDHGIGNIVADDGERLNNLSIAAPSLERERYVFNNSHVVATNWLFKPNKDTDLRLQIDGVIDKTNQNVFRQTTMLDIGQDGAVVTERQDATNKRNEWKGELLYKLNSDKTFISNSIKGYADFNLSRGLSVLNGEEVPQRVEPRKRYLADEMKYIRNLAKGHSLSLGTRLRYSYLPGFLLLHDGNTEQIGMHHFSWSTATYFRHKIAGSYITWNVGEKYDSYHQKVVNPLAKQNDKYSMLSIYITPSFSYKSHVISIAANAKTSWNHRRFNGISNTKIAFEPSASMTLNVSPYVKTSLDYYVVWSPASMDVVSETTVFTDYITLTEGLGYLTSSDLHLLSHAWRYNDPAHGLSADVAFSLNHVSDANLYNSSYADGFYKRAVSNDHGTTNTYALNGRIAKSIGWGKLSLALNGRVSWRSYNLLVKAEKASMKQRLAFVGVELSWHPCDWFSVEETSKMNFVVQSSSNNNIESKSLRYFRHSVDLFIMPGKWQMEWQNEYYHSTDRTISNNYFCDFKVSYRDKAFEVGLSCTNIFGTSRYERSVISDNLRTYTINTLRPRAVMLMLSVSL